MDIGRLDVAQVLKRYFNTKGAQDVDLSDSIVPTAQVADLSEGLPFSIAIPFQIHVLLGAGGAGNWGGFSIHHVLAGAARGAAWLEVTAIQNLTATEDFEIAVNTAAAVALASNMTILPRRLRGVSDLGGLGDWNAFGGFAGVLPTTPLFRLTQGEWYKVNFAISQGRGEFGAFNMVRAGAANTAWQANVHGVIHLAESR